MDKKRVRVYKPGGTLSIFEDGGMQQMQQMPGSDQGGNIKVILDAYVQMQGLTQQEAQKFYTEFASLQPDEQQQVLVKISEHIQGAQSLQAAAPDPSQMPQAKFGASIKNTKKLMHKKIGGITADPNTTSDNVIENRAQQIMRAVGANWARSAVDKSFEDFQNARNQAGAAMSQMAVGGTYGWESYLPFYGGYGNPAENPRIQDAMLKEAALNNSGRAFLGAARDIIGSAEPIGVKMKTRGPMFEDMQNNVDYINPQENSNLTSNQAAEQMFGLKNGGRIPSYQNAGTIDIGTGIYDPNTKTITGTDGTTRVVDEDEANWIMSQDWDNSDATNTSTATNTNPSNYFTGWKGGFYIKDGIVQYGVPGQDSGLSSGNMSFAYPGIKSVQDFIAGYGPQGIANAFKSLTPDNVYMSKFKARPGKIVAKWRYMPDGSVQAVDGTTDATNFSATEDGPTPVKSNIVNRLISPFRSSAEDNSNGSAFSNLMGKAKGAFNEMQARKWARKYGEPEMPTVSEPTAATPVGSLGYMVPASPAQGSSTISQMMTQGQTGSYSDMANPSFYQNEQNLTPIVPVNANDIPQIPGFDQGGRAGKLVLKNKYAFDNNKLGLGLLTGADMISAGLEANQSPFDETDTIATSWNQTLREGMPMSRGSWGKGAGQIGQDIAWLQPGYQQAYRFPQNPGELSSMNPNFYGADGGTYQLGGPIYDNEDDYVYLSDDEIKDIMKRGGKVQYL